MRLIDADAFDRTLEDAELEAKRNRKYVFASALNIIRGNLRNAPTKQKKGKWDFMGWQMLQCSECKHTFTQEFLEGWSEYTYESLFPPFCPNCGAKMEG